MKTIDEEIISNFNSEQHRLVVNILYTSEWLSSQVTEVLKVKGITSIQYNLLRILLGSSPNSLSVGNIKRRLIQKNTDVTRILDRLVAKGLVKREVCQENRRQIDISISKKGIKLMEEISPLLKVKTNSFYEDFISEKGAKSANKILDKMRTFGHNGNNK